LATPELPPDGMLEMDGLWTRTRRGRTELKVIRDAAAGTALGSFGSWSEVIDRAWQLGRSVRRISCPCFICCGSIGGTLGHLVLRRRLDADSLAEGQEWARGIMRLTDGAASYWREKTLSRGLRHLATGQVEHRTSSRLERHNRELRRREKLGTVWTGHNLLALLQAQGLINQTT